MPEASADLDIVYTDYTLNDLSIASIMSGEDTVGFTIFTSVPNIPRINSKGRPVACSLGVSFGDPNFGTRIGKNFKFGPTEFEVPADGLIVACLTIGYFRNDRFGILGGNTVLIPDALNTGTICAYFQPGNSESQVTNRKVYAFAPDPFPLVGPLTEAPRDFRITAIEPTLAGLVDVSVEFSYDNALGENPPEFTLWFEDANGNTSNHGHIPFAGVDYAETITVGIMWAGVQGPVQFFISPYNDTTDEAGPGSNPIAIQSPNSDPEYQAISPSNIVLLPPTPPKAQQLTLPQYVNNLSGIYTLSNNLRFDRVYNRAPFYEEDDLTVNVAIPNPRYKTAFIP